MNLADAGRREAWQPLTPPGVAAFAAASPRRLMLLLVIFAFLAGVSLTAFLKSAWFPAIAEAAHNLPDVGYIRAGRLAWAGDSPVILTPNPWLSVTVDLHHEQALRLPSDLQVEFSSESVRFLSLAGYLDLPYPKGWIIVFNEPELGAWWNAWEPFLAAGAGVLTGTGLMLTWMFLGAAYAVPARVICRFVGHDVGYGAVWRVCCAAQLPGCLLMSFTLLLYSLRAIDLVQALFIAAAHLVVGWVYLFLALFFLPEPAEPRPRRRANPFGTR